MPKRKEGEGGLEDEGLANAISRWRFHHKSSGAQLKEGRGGKGPTQEWAG